MTETTRHSTSNDSQETALASCRSALRRVSILLPHLAGLAHRVRLQVELRVSTAGIFASGRLCVNPSFIETLAPRDLTFVMAHELLHLALDTHTRGLGSKPRDVNVAHDYIINDILREELTQDIPSLGLDWRGASNLSLEEILKSVGRNGPGYQSWGAPRKAPSPMERALSEAGLTDSANTPEVIPPGETPDDLDVLTESLEREWYTDCEARSIQLETESIRLEAAKANSLREAIVRLAEAEKPSDRVEGDSQVESEQLTALKTFYRPPWELALQRWFDAQAPTLRTYSRPSRRGGHTRAILPGRLRNGWAMHLVLDTSGSMTDDLARCLGLIGAFCENASVSEVHVLQCDTDVTVDEWIAPEELESYKIVGFGGSDMSPAMWRLANDPDVEAAVVLTDGGIDIPQQPVPYEVLWAVLDVGCLFEPDYGMVVPIPRKMLQDQ